MMGALPFDGSTAFSWSVGGRDIAAKAIGAFQTPKGVRAVLLDTADAHWLANVSADGKLLEIVCGPVNGEQAVTVAEIIVAGIQDHSSTTGLLNILALVVRS